jgi:hypothetical protein
MECGSLLPLSKAAASRRTPGKKNHEFEEAELCGTHFLLSRAYNPRSDLLATDFLSRKCDVVFGGPS